ncbi:MAG: hypothetical protein JSV00_07955 [bacterium]|nr:MAG: hypothetical protein JSV00_07955 [bacterium]
MDDLVDLHAHILPGLDDGPEEFRESVEMVRALREMGFAHIFATPHQRLYSWQGLDPERVKAEVHRLTGALAGPGIPVRIYAGMEYDLDETLLERTSQNPGSAGHLLVDVGFWGVHKDLEGLLGGVVEAGLKVLVVHPERNPTLCRNSSLVEGLLASGIRLAGNLGSLSGMYGQGARRLAHGMLEKDLYWAMASDMHSLEQAPWVRRGLDELRDSVGLEGARRLMLDNPMEIIQALPEESP